MLCPSCRRQIDRDAAFCETCGAVLSDREPPLELVLADGSRIPTDTPLTIGRAAGNSIRLADPSVSRHHARISHGPLGVWIEDLGSSHGTFVDGERVDQSGGLADGVVIRVGDSTLRVERYRDAAAAGRTIVVPPGASLALRTVGAARIEPDVSMHTPRRPRIRSGWALKRLDASEGDQRYVLRDLVGDDFLRMTSDDAALFGLIDGTRTLGELVVAAEARLGERGASHLAKLLADLSEHGLLAGIDGRGAAEPPTSRLARLLAPQTWVLAAAPGLLASLYDHGGWLVFTRVARWLLVMIGVGGVIAVAYLIGQRDATPFVVHHSLGVGSAVFLVGRFAVAVCHEAAHGLAITSYGRRVRAAGLKRILVFPFCFVDTTEAWFEPRRRRFVIAAAGPVSDVTIGGVCALVATTTSGNLLDVLFQLTLAAYTGAVFNLNPLLDRDGYSMLVDELGVPNLRQRSRVALTHRLAGGARGATEPRAVFIYAVATLVWSIVAVGFVAVLSARYYAPLVALVGSRGPVLVVFGVLYLVMLSPVVFAIVRPLVTRRRARLAGGGADELGG
jgi:putative peptide zinc metalloprotease protein